MQINIDTVLVNWETFVLDETKKCDIEYTKEILHIFLGNLGYGKQYTKGLDSLKKEWDLHYNSLEIIYKDITYKISFSEKSTTHGKIKEIYESVCSSFNRPKNEPIKDFDIIVDLNWIQDINTIFIERNLYNIPSSFNSKFFDKMSGRPFLNAKYNNKWQDALSYYMYVYFVEKQEKEESEELTRLRNCLNKNGYNIDFNIVEESKDNVLYRRSDLCFRLNITTLNGQMDIKGYQLFFYYWYKEFWKHCKEISIESAIKYWYKRDVTLTIHYIEDNLNL